MTPQQQSAIETVIGRALTAGEITSIDPLLDPDNRNDVAIADLLSTGRTEVIRVIMNEREVIENYGGGSVAAAALLDKMAAFGQTAATLAPVTRRVVRWLSEPQGLDLGTSKLRTLLDSLVTAGAITAGEAQGLKDLAVRDAKVSVTELSRALNIAEGRSNG